MRLRKVEVLKPFYGDGYDGKVIAETVSSFALSR
jgi:hypothetical protein